MFKRLSLPIFGVLRILVAGYVLLVLLEKPANKDRKSEFSNKPVTENRSDDSSSKNYKISESDIFMQKARSLIGTELCLLWLD